MYKINEEEPATIVHVFGEDNSVVKEQPSVSGFDTIVKVDKKTEEKLVKSGTFDDIAALDENDVSMSATKLVYGASAVNQGAFPLDEPEEPTNPPQEAT